MSGDRLSSIGLRLWPLVAGGLVVALALIVKGGPARSAVDQSWPPFVLVGGLLLIGLVLGRDGLFEAAAARLVALPGSAVTLLLSCYGLVALVTALLNLDTAAVFLTPVLIRVAQRRGLHPAPFLYGSVLMANASSLFLPGSNLTNLLVLSRTHISGGAFLVGMLALSLSATLVTAGGLLVIHRGGLREQAHVDRPAVRAGLGLGFWTALLAAVLMLTLRQSALAVFALGAALATWRVLQGRLAVGDVGDRLGAPVLLGLFGAAVGLGTIARSSGFPGDLLSSASQLETAALAASASIVVNNLPAAVLLSARPLAHPQALLLGLGVGPNLAVSGSLSVLLWWRAANATGVRPSLLSYSRQGIPLAIAAILFALLLNGLIGRSL